MSTTRGGHFLKTYDTMQSVHTHRSRYRGVGIPSQSKPQAQAADVRDDSFAFAADAAGSEPQMNGPVLVVGGLGPLWKIRACES